jgi:hypothetical protein
VDSRPAEEALLGSEVEYPVPYLCRMHRTSTKIFLLFFLLGGVIWVGGGIARMVVGYSVFIPGTLEWNTAQSDQARLQTIWLFTLLGGWTGWSSLVATIGGLGAMYALRGLFRHHGWLLMSAILLVLVLPVQGYIITEDYRLWTYFDRVTGMPLAEPRDIFQIFLTRFSSPIINVMVAMSSLALLTIVALGAMRPLHHPKSPGNHESR